MRFDRISKLFIVVWLSGVCWCLPAAAERLAVHVVNGQRYHLLRDVGAHYGLSYRAFPNGIVQLQSKSRLIKFIVKRREITVDGIQVWLHYPVVSYRGRPAVSEADVRKSLAPLLRSGAYLARRSTAVVVLDPGHGGEDSGALGRRRVQEKRVVLDIANRARVHLANAGIKVYLTRDTDRFIPLLDRTARAARWGANVFVSIHLNAAPNSTSRGVETYILAAPGCPPTAAQSPRSSYPAFGANVFDEANVALGYHLQKAMVQTMRCEDRGLRRARFMVLKNAPCPAALVECGFLSNPKEENLLLQAAHREKIALAIVQGILNYSKDVTAARLAKDDRL